MPSVEMRRTTRVFGARVLRSGRRLLTSQEVIKHMRRAPLAAAGAEDGWIDLLDDRDGGGGGGSGGGLKDNGWRNSDENEGVDEVESRKGMKVGKVKGSDAVKEIDSVTENKRWGVVYSRKRKRSDTSESGGLDKRFGKKFFRTQSRKKIVTEDSTPSVLPPSIPTTEPQLNVNSGSRKKKATRVLVSKPTRFNLRPLPHRNSVSVHRGIQKRRSSLRSRNRRNPSSFRTLNSSGVVVADGVPFFPLKSNPEIFRSTRRASYKEVKELKQDIDSTSCNASILVIESDRCRREEGAVITMEMSGAKYPFLVVKRNGVERFRVEARDIMRPCFCNRITNAIIWAGSDESWKLEFPNRPDWVIFKELYSECSERTIQALSSLASIIPVPQVNEVSGYADEEYIPFKMPDLYIKIIGDEVSRILEKSDPVYDMDSDDDEWLNKYNDGHESQVDENIFENIVDAFERGRYCSPEDYLDVTKAVERCLKLASKDILEAVHGYWMAKRKKKRSALVQAFEFYKPKKPERLNLKTVLRKKRSFRKRGSPTGRGKQLTFLKATLYDETNIVAAEAENITAKVEEAKQAATRAEEAAISKRQRAQLLMEVADFLTYKASIALKIAEARATLGTIEDNNTPVDDHFLPVSSSDFT